MWFMALFWLFIVALLIVGAVVVARMLSRRSGQQSGQHDALSILQERFARGEIDRQEYEERRSRVQRQT